ncbi:MAG: DNA-binding protein [Candidatus Aenigmatarchaeota archaeon]
MDNNIQQQILQQQLQETQVQAILKEIASKILEKKARERLANLRIVKPDVANLLEIYLVQQYKSGNIPETMSDEHLVELIQYLARGKREPKMKIVRK